MENIINNTENQKNTEARLAFINLTDNGDPGMILRFISKYGIQENPIKLNSRELYNLKDFIGFTLFNIETDLSYDSAIRHWKILKDAGILTKQALGDYILSYVGEKMSANEEDTTSGRKKIANKKFYGEEFIIEFKKDLKERVKESLGWDLDI